MMRNKRKLFAILAVLFAIVFTFSMVGCSGSDDDDDGGVTTGISGTITSASTGAALAYATVTAGSESATTGSDGTYSIALSAGTYSVSVTRPGYTGQTEENVSVTSGQTTTKDFSLQPMSAGTYIGSDQCGVCHTGKYASFMKSGHPYKLNKVVNATMPTYPFSSLEGALEMLGDDDQDTSEYEDTVTGTDNPNGTPQSYADVTYVIGGFGWKARFIDKDGYIVTGTSVQYNLETQAMASYHNNETKTYNCGNCHTTGWKHYDDTLNPNRQDGLAGMDGTFAIPGVHCEACHGAGSSHAISGSTSDITKEATPRTTEELLASDMAYGKPVACSECHVRDSERDYPDYTGGPGRIAASGGFIRHHEQYEELQGINPDDSSYTPNGSMKSLKCVDCHSPHNTTVYESVSGTDPGVEKECTVCHSDKTITSGGMTNLSCTDCHMPNLVKSAIAHDAVGSGPKTGDISSHIFKIDLSKTEQFTSDGKYAYPWLTGEYACKTCHNGETVFELTFPSTTTIHK